MAFEQVGTWFKNIREAREKAVMNLFNFVTRGDLTRVRLWDAALTAAEKGDLAPVRDYFSKDHVKADIASHPFQCAHPDYMAFLTVAGKTNNSELAQFVLDQGIRPMGYIVEDLKKEGADNAVTALLEKNIVILYPKKDRNLPKP